MKHFVALLAVACLLAGCRGLRPDRAPTEPRVFPCRRLQGSITLDGRPDEPAWERAHFITDFRHPVSGARPQAPTGARFLWDDEYLYVAAVMKDRDVYALKTEHDAKTWEDDACELFLKPSDAEPAYFEVHVTPLGTTLDLLIARRGAGAFERWTPWESGLRAEAEVQGTLNDWSDEDRAWTIEAALPWKGFRPAASRPQLGDRWRVAVNRYNYSVHLEAGRELSSSARLTSPSFHHYEDYDYLEFVD
ncbi:MAG: carbohydrate-binding family 9-like protein [Candidatus Brocadiia bacterium]